MNKERLSNLELLRIVSMLLVLIVHSSFASLGIPSKVDIEEEPFSSFMRFFVQSGSIICVNCFILISGYFGMRLTFKGIFKLLFQILFISFFVYFSIIIWTPKDFSWAELIKHSDIFSIYWFIPKYLGLLFLSPILNKFIQYANEKEFRYFLIIFGLFQLFFGWIHNWGGFNGGYSILSFIFLYLLGRYVAIHENIVFQKSKIYDITYYTLLTIFITVVALIMRSAFDFEDKDIVKWYHYNSPFVILSSLFFFLFFTKLKFKSQIVNFIASSAFAIYLLHFDPLVFNSYFKSPIKSLFDSESIIVFAIEVIGIILVFFILSIIIDRLRITIYHPISNIIDNLKNSRHKE